MTSSECTVVLLSDHVITRVVCTSYILMWYFKCWPLCMLYVFWYFYYELHWVTEFWISQVGLLTTQYSFEVKIKNPCTFTLWGLGLLQYELLLQNSSQNQISRNLVRPTSISVVKSFWKFAQSTTVLRSDIIIIGSDYSFSPILHQNHYPNQCLPLTY